LVQYPACAKTFSRLIASRPVLESSHIPFHWVLLVKLSLREVHLSPPVSSSRGAGGSRYKLLGPGGPEGGRSSNTLHMFLSLSVLSLLVNCTNCGTQTLVNLQLRLSLSRFIASTFNPEPPLLEGGRRKIIFTGARTHSQPPYSRPSGAEVKSTRN